MKKLLVMFIIFTFLGIQIAVAADNKTATSGAVDVNVQKLTESAKSLVDDLNLGNYKEASVNFDDVMKAQVSEEKLQGLWKSLISQCGNFNGQLGTRYEAVQGYDVIYVTLAFEKQNLDMRIVFNKSFQVSGLFLQPAAQTDNKEQKDEVKAPDSIIETSVTVGSGEWALPGTLSMPKGNGTFPVVILVHGSGPNDRDETIGPNKPFRDIAWGLASKGIAVLRYDKRTKVYPGKIQSQIKGLTVKEETIDDAAAAVKLMQSTKGIDKNKIFVLGHSLGGMLIPRIAQVTKNAAGYIVMAGCVRPLEDLMLEQYNYILSIDKTMEQSKKDETLKQIKTAVNSIKNLKKSDINSSGEILGAPVSYWLDLKGYNPARTAKSIKKPMLIMQGERDYQVTLTDFNLWKSNLSGNKNVTFKSYKDLNHLFITGKGKSTPQEYEVEGHVSVNAINDIYNWVKYN